MYRILFETGSFGAHRAGELRAVKRQHRWSRKRAVEPTHQKGLACVACRNNVTSWTIQVRDIDGAYHQIGMGIIDTTWLLETNQAVICRAKESMNAWVTSDEQCLPAKVARHSGARDWCRRPTSEGR